MKVSAGDIIFLNGTSSSGKSTLCKAVRSSMAKPFWHFSSDHFVEADGGMQPRKEFEEGTFDWQHHRKLFFSGFHRAIPAFAQAGNNLIVEHIVESAAWANQLAEILDGFDVFVVSVVCPEHELVRRETERGDRAIGEAKYHLKTYDFAPCDMEVDSTKSVQQCVDEIIVAWRSRPPYCNFTERWRAVI